MRERGRRRRNRLKLMEGESKSFCVGTRKGTIKNENKRKMILVDI